MSSNSLILTMDFSEIIGQETIKSHLKNSIRDNRIPHAQLFTGNPGSGLLPMAIAFAKDLLCSAHEKNSPGYLNCANKVAKLSHPDLHFIYPVNTTEDIKKNAVSDNFSEEWRNFVLRNPYASLFEWLQNLGIENKQGNISKFEAEAIAKKLSLKAYEGGHKILIIWMAELMNPECSNKILKILEEPPEKTILLLLTENEDRIISTIRSRCQRLHFPSLSENDIMEALVSKHFVSENEAKKIASQSGGDFTRALQLIENSGEDLLFEGWFITWVRTAFRAKGHKNSINQLLDWSDVLAAQGRETQKKYLSFCLDIFRQALLLNYKTDSLLFFEINDKSFSLEKFSPFVHQNNIFEISTALEDAYFHIERNGNSKIIFTDLSIQLTRLIHKPELV